MKRWNDLALTRSFVFSKWRNKFLFFDVTVCLLRFFLLNNNKLFHDLVLYGQHWSYLRYSAWHYSKVKGKDK